MNARTALAAAALLLLTACAPAGSGGPAPGTPEPADPGQRRAAQVLRAWEGSAAERGWREGYFPVGEPKPKWLPQGVSKEHEVAVFTGQWFFHDFTPAPPTGKGTVRWADGRQVEVPLLSAKAALDEHSRQVGCMQCPPKVAITGARLSTRTIPTNRGQATVPVWEFTVHGYAEPFAYPAVLPSGGTDRPTPSPSVLMELDRTIWPAEPVGLAPDGLTLDVVVKAGVCVRLDALEAVETDRSVVLIARQTPQPRQEGCTTEPRGTVRLTRPLAGRTLLDLNDGHPQPLPG
ncbi:hypothetical protein ACIA8O_05145 [Kitasatospora sp. NPDC051853]|uniref:hypothetical protein n=1 Tax=Kitasatospora sp. NPDC051853 TaxID=3364058 RepID=UPI0037B26C7D